MVAIKDVRASNATLKSQAPGQVSVFVGATSGIGHATLTQLAKVSNAPKIYLVGRSKSKLSNIAQELQTINPAAKIETIAVETSLLEQVDVACKQILQNESKIDVLFMSTGYLGLEQTFTSEGLDELASLRHYSRLRFVYNLLPLLNKAPAPHVVSVLAGGKEGKLYTPDLSLKTNYSFSVANEHFTTLHTLALEELAKTNPSISFLHVYPGLVDTGIADRFLSGLKGGVSYYLGQLAMYLILPIVLFFGAVPIEEAGERGVFHATSSSYPSRKLIEEPDALKGVAVKNCSVTNNGVYRVNWDGETFDDSKVLGPYRQDGMGSKVWDHTLEVFDQSSRG